MHMGLMSSPIAFKHTWSSLRDKANHLGIPAWKLAEDLGVHEPFEEVDKRESVKVGTGGTKLNARNK